MINIKKEVFVVVATMIFSSPLAFAQQAPVDGISFRLGADVQTVKSALNTNLDPEPQESTLPSQFPNPNAGKSILFLRTKGIRAFFNKKDVLEIIRFDAPFSGAIGGIKIGDSEKKLREVKGAPIKKPWKFGATQSFLYAVDDTAYVRYDISENDGVQEIFISK